MARFISYKDGNKTDEVGFYRIANAHYTEGVIDGFSQTPGSGLSVDINSGDSYIADNEHYYHVWSDDTENITLTTADISNPRIDVIVAYVDNGDPADTVNSNSPGIFKIEKVDGVPAASPAAPNSTTIETQIGASNPYFIIAEVTVPASAATVLASDISSKLVYSQPKTSVGSLGWIPTNVLPDTITNEGQREQQLIFNNVDLTNRFSPGMLLRSTRNTPTPTQSGLLDRSSSQYYAKTSGITGITFTTTFTVVAKLKLNDSETSVGQTVLSRMDGNNGFRLWIDQFGRPTLTGYAGSTYSNQRRVTANMRIPTGRWVEVGISANLATSSYVVVVDGKELAFSVETQGGTNPTALIQGGDLVIGAYETGASALDGNIAHVGLFDTALSASTMAEYAAQPLTGSEANCVGAWDLAGNGNDASSNANNLSATNGASYQSTTNFGNGLGGALDYAEITDVSYSTNTTITIKCPLENIFPVTGGISALDYSTTESPYLYPIKDKRNPMDWFESDVTGTGSALGNGLTSCMYRKEGKYIVADFWFKLSADSTVGAILAMKLPEPYNIGAYQDSPNEVGRSYFDDNSSIDRVGSIRLINGDEARALPISANDTYAGIVATSATVPFTWTSNDALYMQVRYQYE